MNAKSRAPIKMIKVPKVVKNMAIKPIRNERIKIVSAKVSIVYFLLKFSYVEIETDVFVTYWGPKDNFNGKRPQKLFYSKSLVCATGLYKTPDYFSK